MCRYYLDCKTTCNTTCKVRRVPAYCQLPTRCYCPSEITLWETADEKKLYCPDCGISRIVKIYNPCADCPFARCNRLGRKNTEKFHIIIW